jgi:hypothetical protein
MEGRTHRRRNASVQNEVHDFSTFHSATHSAVKLVVAARVVFATDAETVAMAERTRCGMTIPLA